MRCLVLGALRISRPTPAQAKFICGRRLISLDRDVQHPSSDSLGTAIDSGIKALGIKSVGVLHVDVIRLPGLSLLHSTPMKIGARMWKEAPAFVPCRGDRGARTFRWV